MTRLIGLHLHGSGHLSFLYFQFSSDRFSFRFTTRNNFLHPGNGKSQYIHHVRLILDEPEVVSLAKLVSSSFNRIQSKVWNMGEISIFANQIFHFWIVRMVLTVLINEERKTAAPPDLSITATGDPETEWEGFSSGIWVYRLRWELDWPTLDQRIIRELFVIAVSETSSFNCRFTIVFIWISTSSGKYSGYAALKPWHTCTSQLPAYVHAYTHSVLKRKWRFQRRYYVVDGMTIVVLVRHSMVISDLVVAVMGIVIYRWQWDRNSRGICKTGKLVVFTRQL